MSTIANQLRKVLNELPPDLEGGSANAISKSITDIIRPITKFCLVTSDDEKICCEVNRELSNFTIYVPEDNEVPENFLEVAFPPDKVNDLALVAAKWDSTMETIREFVELINSGVAAFSGSKNMITGIKNKIRMHVLGVAPLTEQVYVDFWNGLTNLEILAANNELPQADQDKIRAMRSLLDYDPALGIQGDGFIVPNVIAMKIALTFESITNGLLNYQPLNYVLSAVNLLEITDVFDDLIFISMADVRYTPEAEFKNSLDILNADAIQKVEVPYHCASLRKVKDFPPERRVDPAIINDGVVNRIYQIRSLGDIITYQRLAISILNSTFVDLVPQIEEFFQNTDPNSTSLWKLLFLNPFDLTLNIVNFTTWFFDFRTRVSKSMANYR